jgi:type IV secretory pathway VirB2 component (pilin)
MKSFLPSRLRSWSPAVFIAVAIAGMLFSTGASAKGIWDSSPECLASSITITFPDGSGDSSGFGFNQDIGDNPICEMFIWVKQTLISNGQWIATLAIMALGAGAFFGKITWPQALVVALGVGLMFGADTFIEAMDPTLVLNFNYGSYSYQDPVTAVLGMIIATMSGSGSREIAVVCIAILGLGALYGKISWGQTLVLIAGIALVFGAITIIATMQNAVQGGTMGFLNDISQYYRFFDNIVQDPLINNRPDPIGGPFLNLIDFMTGDIGVSLATVGVIAVGFAAMIGKLSWVQAMLLATGVALIFGAADVIVILSSPLAICTKTSTDSFTQVICGFMEEVQGPMGKTLGTLAIIILGILSTLGKVSWELAFVVTIGIALIFGADTVVSLFENNMNGINCGTAVPSAPSTGNAIADVLCYIIMILYGPAGKALATVAVIMMGFGALMGKVSYSQAFVVAVGIAVTFGAPDIVTIIMSSANTTGCTAVVNFGSGAGSIINGNLGDVNGC